MKVTAIIPDELVNAVQTRIGTATVTEALTIALKDWLDIYNIKQLNIAIAETPIVIASGQKIRKANRAS